VTSQPHLPPKLAPEGTPFAVALYLDRAAEQLRPIVERDALQLVTYDICQPEDFTWGHHVYGKVWDRDYAIQIIANDTGARTFKGIVIGFVLHYVQGKEEWIDLEYRETLGMAGMAACVRETVLKMRIACALRMPHITEPDIKT
jgi:hypothetical protein